MTPSEETAPRLGIIARVIEGSARRPLVTILFVLVLGAWGYYSLRSAPLDAIPDLSDTQVIIFTEWPGRSPDLVEDQITTRRLRVVKYRGSAHGTNEYPFLIDDHGITVLPITSAGRF